MPLILIVAFIVVPIVELAVIGAVSGRIGLGWTLLLLLVDSVIGAVLVRSEGRKAWHAFRQALAELRWPGDEVVQGALVLVGGALLLTPGFVTDVAGALMVLPWTRPPIARVLRRLLTPAPLRTIRDLGGDLGAGRRQRRDDQGAVMDVEVISVERDEPPRDDAAPTP